MCVCVLGRFILVYRSGRNAGGLREGAHREIDGGATGGMEGWRWRRRGGMRGGEREGGRGDGGIKVRAVKQLTHTAGWIIATPPAPISPLCATLELYGSHSIGGGIERTPPLSLFQLN